MHITKRYQILFTFLSMFLLLNTSSAQEVLEVFGQIKSEMPDLKSAEVRISEDGGKFQSIKFNKRNGKFDLALPIGHIFTFEFAHTGCITKQIEISTKCPKKYHDFVFDPFYFSVQLELYSETPAIDTLFYDRPVGKVYFSETYEKFEYDREYIMYVRDKIQNAVEQELLASLKREALTDEMNASTASLESISQSAIDQQVLSNFNPDSAKASELASIEIDPIANLQDLTNDTHTENVTEASSSSPLKTDVTNTTPPKANELASATVETSPEKENEKVLNSNAILSEQTIAQASPAIEKTVQKNKVEDKTNNQTITNKPQLASPGKPTKTSVPQFKQRPARKTFDNSEYAEGLWTRVYINDGARITKYTMIQYNSGKTAYYKQDRFETDSVLISRSIFMRMISY